jgi:hypothetical protein
MPTSWTQTVNSFSQWSVSTRSGSETPVVVRVATAN